MLHQFDCQYLCQAIKIYEPRLDGTDANDFCNDRSEMCHHMICAVFAAPTNSHKYSPILILTGVVGPIGTFYPTHHNGNTDGNGPKWQCAGSSCRIARRFNAPFQSRIGISIRYFKHFNLTFRTFQSVRQLITQSGTRVQPIRSP